MMVDLSKVDPNPFRDFTLDPLSPESVEKMEESISELGFWGGIAVRKAGDRFQLAFGHHRLQALKNLGWTEADINEVNYDDDKMVSAMIKENLIQRENELTARNDAVAGVIRRLGYLLLTGSPNNYSEMFESQKAFDVAKGTFLNGDGIGIDLIKKYQPIIPIAAIRNALSSMKESGYYGTILNDIKVQIQQEIAEKKKEQKTLKDAEDKAEAKKSLERLDAAKKETTDLQIREEQLAKAYNIECDTLFSRQSHSKVFKDWLLKDPRRWQDYFTPEKQPDLVLDIFTTLEKDGERVTAESLKTGLNNLWRNFLGEVKVKELKQEPQAAREFKHLIRQVSNVYTLAETVSELLESQTVRDSSAETFFNITVPGLINTIKAIESKVVKTSDILEAK